MFVRRFMESFNVRGTCIATMNRCGAVFPLSDTCPDSLGAGGEGRGAKVAIATLGRIGETALPPLLGVATNRAKPTQFRRLVLDTISPRNFRFVGFQHTPIQDTLPDHNDTSSLIPILLPCLHEKGLEDSTIRLLGRLGLTADTAFQVFTNGITAKNVDVRIAAVRWAALFKSNAPRATPELIKCFNDPDAAVRRQASNALQKIAPDVLTNAFSQTDH
jgi:hypothetical protein